MENSIGMVVLLLCGLAVFAAFAVVFAVFALGIDWIASPPWRKRRPTYPSEAERRGFKDVV